MRCRLVQQPPERSAPNRRSGTTKTHSPGPTSHWRMGSTLVPHGTALEGRLYPGWGKNRSSRAPIGVPEQVRSVIEAWKKLSPNSSPDALMFPTFGRREPKGRCRGGARTSSAGGFVRLPRSWRTRIGGRLLGISARRFSRLLQQQPWSMSPGSQDTAAVTTC